MKTSDLLKRAKETPALLEYPEITHLAHSVEKEMTDLERQIKKLEKKTSKQAREDRKSFWEGLGKNPFIFGGCSLVVAVTILGGMISFFNDLDREKDLERELEEQQAKYETLEKESSEAYEKLKKEASEDISRIRESGEDICLYYPNLNKFTNHVRNVCERRSYEPERRQDKRDAVR